MIHQVSLIIPAYQKFHEIELLLYSLERQTFDSGHMEVIVINDGSTDGTAKMLRSYRPSFNFRFINNKERMGRSFARNQGIKAAGGDIIIFLDAEMIVQPDFVQKHADHHHERHNLVVTGGMHLRGTFSIYDPSFPRMTRRHIYQLLKQHPAFHKQCIPIIRKASRQKKAMPLLYKKHIANRFYKRLSFPRPYFPEIIQKFGNHLSEYKLPWTAFLSGNVSLRKQLLEQAGGFDEQFKGWGFEDWELGYRLHRCGAIFLADPKVGSYHQEHATSPTINRDMYTNFCYYQRKHPYFETGVHAIFLLGMSSRLHEHTLVEEHQRLIQSDVMQYKRLISALLHMFNKISILLKNGKSTEEILFILQQESKELRQTAAYEERIQLVNSGLCPAIVQLFDDLTGNTMSS